MIAEDLRAAGWIYKSNGYWCHPSRSGQCSEDIALELLETIQSRDTFSETLKQQRWRDGEAHKISYVIASYPPFQVNASRIDSFKGLMDALPDVFEQLKDRPKEVGMLVYSLVSKKHDKVTFPDGTECKITEYYINTLFKWDGYKWINIFGNAHELCKEKK